MCFSSVAMKALTSVRALLLLAPLCSSCGDSSVRVTFRDVSDTRDGQAFIGADYPSARDVPDYVIRNGRLYLTTQTYWIARPRADRVQSRRWTCTEVARLKRSADVRTMLPDVAAVDGGIRWSECSQIGAPPPR